MIRRWLRSNGQDHEGTGCGRVRRAFHLWAAATVMATLVVPALVSQAGAATGCGAYSFGFPGTRLLNDGISDVSGPYPIELPAGVYTVTLVAHDHHDTQIGVSTQIGEQYIVELDSGYHSPPSEDIPDALIMTTTVFPSQVIGASSSITVRHAGVPGINSVDVVCVGFTPEIEVEVEGVVETPETEPALPTQPAVPESPTAPAEPLTPGVVAPNPVLPDTDVPVERPAQDIGDPVGIVRLPGPEAAAPTEAEDTPVETEVQGIVEAPPSASQLAITGPGEQAKLLLGASALLLAAGALLVLRQRRVDGPT